MLSIKFIVLVLMLHSGDVAGNAWSESLSTVLKNGLREDLDIGTLIGNLYYQIDPGYGSVIYSTNSSTFNVDPSSGRVTLAQPLSFENQPTFGVIFFAKSLSGLQDPVIVQVNVLAINHPPMFDLPVYQISVKENAAVETTIYKGIYVTDRDQSGSANGTVVKISCSSDSQTDEAISSCQTFKIQGQLVPDTPHRYFGSVVLIKSLNYTTKKSYNVTVVAQDGGTPPLNSTSYLIVSVESSADTRPIFINSPVIINMKESDRNSTVLTVLQAKDGSTDNPKDLTFQISSDPLHWFFLDPPTQDNTKMYSVPIRTYGNVSLPAINMNTEYSFTVKATEMLNNQLTSVSSETTIQVNIQDTNTNAPIFDKPNYYVNVTEGLGILATLPGLNMVITDKDLGDNAYFTLSCMTTPRPTPDIFLVIPTFGQGTVSATLVANKPEFLSYDDPSKRFYTVVVTATELRTAERFSGSATVTINVLSSLNHPPYFPATEYPIAINDGISVGTMITNLIRASDIDLGTLGQLTYSLSPANPAFQIDSNSAVIRLAQVLNATATPIIYLTVIATDGGGLSANASVKIEVIDSRHAGPKFVNSFGTDTVDSYNTNVTELTNNLIPSITVRALSVPLSHDLLVVYTIVNGNDNGLFALDFSSGVLMMNHGVDYNDTPNRQGYFELTVQASYNNYPEKPVTNTSVYIHILDTNNHAPTFSPSYYSTSVTEITPPGTSLLTVGTSDLDFGSNAKVHYIVTDGSRDNFVIDYTTGIVSVASHPNLDIKQFGNQYNVTILATDEGSPAQSATAMVYIHVNDSVYQNPTFSLNPAAYSFKVVDNATANTPVGPIPATSPNARAVIVYSIIPNTMQATSKNGAPVQPGPNDFTKWFAINNRTGDIIVVASNRISYDLVAQIDFKVLANVTNPDVKSTLSNTANVTIRIIPPAQNLDIVTFNPILAPDKTIRLSINDRLPVPSFITQFAAYYYADNKNINNFVFGPNQTDYFALNQTTGILTVNKSILYEQLPPEKTLSFIVVAKAPPPSTAASSATVIITVQQRSVDAPAFELPNYDFYVNSNRPLNYFIGRVVASYRSDSVLTYDLTGQGSDYFHIDPNNGSITLMKRLDQQPVLLYGLRATATATNNSVNTTTPPTGTVQVSIHVIPIHVNPPVFSNAPYSVNTQITLIPGTPIGQVFAKDPDIFAPTFITYNIAGGNERGLFNISNTTGIIMIAKNLSVALSGVYQLNVSATDAANPPLVSYTTFTITVDNSSTGTPTFDFPSSDYIFYAYEKKPNNTEVKTKDDHPVVILGVPHRAAYPIITYSLSESPESPKADTKFNINPSNGSLTVNGTLYRSNGTSYLIFVKIADNGKPAFSNSLRINITVISDDPPTFLCPGATPNINADVQGNLDPFNPPYKVLTLKACSNDLPNTKLYYSITGGNGPYIDNITSPFRIDENGQVFTNVKLFWYYSPTLTINVTVASNASEVPKAMKLPNSTVSITFNVIGGNNNGPLFYSPIPQCSGIGRNPITGIMDVTEFGTQVIQLYAGDCDPPQFRNNTYSIDNIFWNNQGTLTQVKDAFTIEPDTGIVRTHFTDYRIYYQGVFQVTVRASDMTGQQNPDTTNLLVYIVREGQKLKFEYSKKPTDLRPQRNDFINGFNQLLTTPYKQKIYADPMVSNVDGTGYPLLDQTAMCYFVVDNSNSQAPYGSIVSVGTFRSELDNTTGKLDIKTENDLFNKYSVINASNTCYKKETTMWWPRVNVDDQFRSSWNGYWFLWFILIAFAIFIFFVALVLVICVCFYWIRNHRSMAANRPYVVIDEPPMSQAGASEIDWGGR